MWQYVHCRAPPAAPRPRRAAVPASAASQPREQVPDRCLPTAEQLAMLLRRQRAYLRRLHLEQGAVAGGEAAELLAAVLAAATADGSGLEELTLSVDALPDAVVEVRA